MMFFNTAGPVFPEKHYHINPLERLDLKKLLFLIEQEKYCVLHAPRQTGKTSCLLALMKYLNNQGRYRCVYLNVEVAQAAGDKVKNGIGAVLHELANRIEYYFEGVFTPQKAVEVLNQQPAETALNYLLSYYVRKSNKPMIFLIDEIDSLIGDTLISVLR